MSASFFYGCLGVSVALYSNAVRKLPLMRQPWDHVLYFGIGAFLGSRVEGYKEGMRQTIEQTLAEREKLSQERAARIAARKAAGEL